VRACDLRGGLVLSRRGVGTRIVTVSERTSMIVAARLQRSLTRTSVVIVDPELRDSAASCAVSALGRL
jgi:hypothetical protein